MRSQDKQMTKTGIAPSPQQRASGAKSSPIHSEPPSRFSQVGHFLLHWGEMMLAMCIGGCLLTVLAFGAIVLIGYPDPRQQFPEWSLLFITFSITWPMVLWMRFRGMQWRPILEMASETIALAILLLGLGGIGIIDVKDWLLGFCGLACLLMFIPMLFRLDLYTGRSGHHMQAA